MTKRITITITDKQFENLNKIVENGVWGNKPSSVVKEILILKLNTTEKTIEKALKKAGWEETYVKGKYMIGEEDKYQLIRTFQRKIPITKSERL